MILLLLLLSTFAAATPSPINGDLQKFEINNNGIGQYSFEYETADGTYRQEDGGLVEHSGVSIFVVRGEYGFQAPNGQLFVVQYIADENGFRARQEDARFNDRRIV